MLTKGNISHRLNKVKKKKRWANWKDKVIPPPILFTYSQRNGDDVWFFSPQRTKHARPNSQFIIGIQHPPTLLTGQFIHSAGLQRAGLGETRRGRHCGSPAQITLNSGEAVGEWPGSRWRDSSHHQHVRLMAKMKRPNGSSSSRLTTDTSSKATGAVGGVEWDGIWRWEGGTVCRCWWKQTKLPTEFPFLFITFNTIKKPYQRTHHRLSWDSIKLPYRCLWINRQCDKCRKDQNSQVEHRECQQRMK